MSKQGNHEITRLYKLITFHQAVPSIRHPLVYWRHQDSAE